MEQMRQGLSGRADKGHEGLESLKSINLHV